MKTSKKMLSLLLIAAMLVSVLCMGVSASDTTFEPVSISEGEPVKIVWSGTTGTVVNVDGGTPSGHQHCSKIRTQSHRRLRGSSQRAMY